MGDQLNNIQAAYHVLAGQMFSALRTQLRDLQRLAEVTSQALSLSSAAEQVTLLPNAFLPTLTSLGSILH
jgi:hypothetical protein